MDDNLTPSDIKPSVSEFTDSSDDESYGKESKNKEAAKVWTVSIEEYNFNVLFVLFKRW